MIFENAAITVFIGDKYTGAPPVFTTGTNFLAQARRYETTDKVQSKDTSGASGYVANRYHSREAKCSLTGVLPATGTMAFLRNATGGSLVMYNVKVVVKPNSTLTEGDTFIGVCTEWKPSASKGDDQTLTIEIDGAADYSGAAGTPTAP